MSARANAPDPWDGIPEPMRAPLLAYGRASLRFYRDLDGLSGPYTMRNEAQSAFDSAVSDIVDAEPCRCAECAAEGGAR